MSMHSYYSSQHVHVGPIRIKSGPLGYGVGLGLKWGSDKVPIWLRYNGPKWEACKGQSSKLCGSHSQMDPP